MYNTLGIHWASSLPAFLALACVPFPFLFYKYGEKIRLRSKYAAESDAFMKKIIAQMQAGGKEEDEQFTNIEDTEKSTSEPDKEERR
jgi:hypothetical protein